MNTNLFNNAFPFFRLFQKQAGTLGDAGKKLDDLRRAPKTDARGRRLRGDLRAVEQLIETSDA